MATRVSPRSTVTSTCFFKAIPHVLEDGGPSLPRCGVARLRVDRLQKADGQECDEHRRAAEAQKWCRDARDRHDPDGHPTLTKIWNNSITVMLPASNAP